ncbi:hypothetical protein CHH55_18000 [Niallia circulans]|uniref:hypothetical protein n=1 Tax=Niallia circulans TaxID=1397 RepID=UPI000BA5C777|nr:hypothetical protein [Niallia circulans]PAD86442.1 hypothetical protein CHH55_18000 [Niallia circulans]
MKKDFIRLSLSLIILISIFYIFQQKQIAKESITYFPIDPTVTFPKANTTLTFSKKRFDEYSIIWESHSSINKVAYLRQDMSLLYANGKLINTMGEWKQNTLELSGKKTIVERESNFLQAITFHYAEIHDSSERIFSSQKTSTDNLYIINSKFENAPLTFHTASNLTEKDWAKTLEKEALNDVEYAYLQVLKKFHISPEQYHTKLLLTDLINYNDAPLPNFSKEQSAKIIGQLTEGLYKNYFLGVIKEDGTIADPIGSSIPVLLINDNHLLILFTTVDGEAIVLRQQISTL